MQKTTTMAAIATLAALLSGTAQAGLPSPGPEIGSGYESLLVLAAVIGGVVLFRFMRARKA